MPTPEELQQRGAGLLPGLLGIVVVHAAPDEMHLELPVRRELMAPNGFLHAGSLVTLADTAAGYGTMQSLPEGAKGFTTVELKSNHLGTLREGTAVAVARPVHRGRTTQVWDVTVTARDTGKTLVLFRCTQLLLYP